MEDQKYRELIKSYDLETLINVRRLIDREVYKVRYDWIEAEIKDRRQGVGPAAAPPPTRLSFSRNETYAGIMYRTPALIIDLLLVYIPSGMILEAFLGNNFWPGVFFIPILYPLYQICCTWMWGQTPGRFLLGIKVVNDNPGIRLGMKAVIQRHSPDLCFAILMMVSIIWMVASGFSLPEHATLDAKTNAFHFTNRYWDLTDDIWDVWIWSEIIFLTLDGRRRSLHEFLSNTVVIHKIRQSDFAAGLNSTSDFESSYYEWLKRQLDHIAARLFHRR